MLNNKGMTLIEVVVTIVIISIIMLAVTTGFVTSLRQDADTTRYQAISDDLKIQLDEIESSSPNKVAQVTIAFGSGGSNTQTVDADMYIVTDAEEPSISFARYVATGVE